MGEVARIHGDLDPEFVQTLNKMTGKADWMRLADLDEALSSTVESLAKLIGEYLEALSGEVVGTKRHNALVTMLLKCQAQHDSSLPKLQLIRSDLQGHKWIGGYNG